MTPADGRVPVSADAAGSLLDIGSLRIAVACARFNRHITDLLLQGALSRLHALGLGEDSGPGEEIGEIGSDWS